MLLEPRVPITVFVATSSLSIAQAARAEPSRVIHTHTHTHTHTLSLAFALSLSPQDCEPARISELTLKLTSETYHPLYIGQD